MNQPDIETDFLIIGAGVSGFAIAEFLLENGKNPILLGSHFESQLAKAGEIKSKHLPNGTVGLKYMESLSKELKEKGLNHKTSLVTNVDFSVTPKLVKTKFQNFKAKNVIIATGQQQQKIGFSGENELFHNGISDCAVCDGNLFREQPIGVVGNHLYTIKSVEYLSKITESLHLLWLDKSLLEEYQTRLDKLENLTIYTNVENLEAQGDSSLEIVKFNCSKGSMKLSLSALFVEGEPKPVVDFLDNQVELDQLGRIKTKNFHTSVSGIYAIGEVSRGQMNFDTIQTEVEAFKSILKALF
jgi:thioredoxin reductase (NADPH)